MNYRAAALFTAFSAAFAFGASAQSPQNRSPFSFGYLHDFKSDIDGGGEVSNDFFYARAGVPLYRSEGRVIALSAGYNFNSYKFDGGTAGSFAALDPWDKVHTFRLGLPVKWDFGSDWTFFGLPSIRSTGESGASFGDSISGISTSGSTAWAASSTTSTSTGFIVRTTCEPATHSVQKTRSALESSA